MPGQNNAIHLRRHVEVPRNPPGRHERGDGDGHHRDLVREPDARREFIENTPQRILREAAGHEQNVRSRCDRVTHESDLSSSLIAPPRH